MLEVLNSASTKAGWLKPVVTIASVVSLSAFLYVVLIAEGASKDVYLIPSVVVFLWTLLFSFLLAVFPNIPAVPDKSCNLLFRAKVRVVRWFYYIVAAFFLVATLAVVLLSMRILNVWRIDF
ncbi:hypothetical protein DU002_03090 [Corallincola holothuriorum]|uniref:Uncharacterized protein n=1 Tax=Corallincola holothuriorum TaxID=2282215 RepID=A0A368NNP5_9GAMM|nr:hypothetical protein [Corallincola holothuriorum]RCU51475.1 hypothetical protein DU002_03090 [Corallincola holothuriorum]